jgi:phage gpG-like protein
MTNGTTGQTRIVADLSDLENLVKELGSTYVARVGILGAKATQQHEETTLTNGEVGTIHEFGSISNNIPARSFLRMPLEAKQKDIVQAMAGQQTQSYLEKGQIKNVYRNLGFFAEAFVKQAFASGGFGQWKPNKPATIARKGSDKPLIDSSQLRRSITSDVVKRSEIE